jgi:hypothetical protein
MLRGVAPLRIEAKRLVKFFPFIFTQMGQMVRTSYFLGVDRRPPPSLMKVSIGNFIH